nr:zinc finger and SCAN domain-containing protein 12-like [Nothobranchius furzeri]XP_054593720.1 zinc finger and SCAN domain-containing protein 12-like [Nothobranchius furzeri]
MDVDASMDYDHVKAAILQKYEISSETYRLRFRSLQVEPNESPRELFVRLKELYGRWVRPRGKTIDEINETIILEQYFRMLSPELQVWIKERNPRDAAEAVSLADAFVAARRRNQSWAYKAMKKDYTPAPGNTSPTENVGKPCGREKYFPSQTKNLGRKPVCYLCGKEGHTKPVCPQNPAKLSQMYFVPRGNHAPNPMNQLLVETTVEIDGQKVKALIDTGSTQSLVHRR